MSCTYNPLLRSSSIFLFIIVLASCENRKETVEVSNFKDHFKYFNLKEFHLDFEKDAAELNEVEDSEFLNILWKNILGTAPTGKTYFYSLQEDLPNYNGFSILCQYEKVGKGLTRELYYVILDSADAYISSLLVAEYFHDRDTQLLRKRYTNLANDTLFTINIQENYADILALAGQTLQNCVIKNNGTIACGDLKNLIAICLWQDIAVNDTAGDSAQYLASLSIGEEVYDLEQRMVAEVHLDSTTTGQYEFAKVELKDGTIGWAPSRFLVFNARLAAVKSLAYLHLKPETNSRTKVNFDTMDIVAVFEKKVNEETWYRIKGKPDSASWFEEGWLKEDALTLDRLNLTVATQGTIALQEEDSLEKFRKVFAIVKSPSLQGSTYIPFLRHQLEKGGDYLYAHDRQLKFFHRNLKEFPGHLLEQIPLLTKVDDKFFVNFLWKNILEMTPEMFDQIFGVGAVEKASFYFYSWQERDDHFIDFTVFFQYVREDGNEVQELYYIILSETGKFINKKIIAGYSKLGRFGDLSESTLEDQTIKIYSSKFPSSDDSRQLQVCIIEGDGEIICEDEHPI